MLRFIGLWKLPAFFRHYVVYLFYSVLFCSVLFAIDSFNSLYSFFQWKFHLYGFHSLFASCQILDDFMWRKQGERADVSWLVLRTSNVSLIGLKYLLVYLSASYRCVLGQWVHRWPKSALKRPKYQIRNFHCYFKVISFQNADRESAHIHGAS